MTALARRWADASASSSQFAARRDHLMVRDACKGSSVPAARDIEKGRHRKGREGADRRDVVFVVPASLVEEIERSDRLSVPAYGIVDRTLTTQRSNKFVVEERTLYVFVVITDARLTGDDDIRI